MRDGGIAGHRLAIGDVVGDAGLRAHAGTVADPQVSDHADLAREHDALAQLGRSADSALGDQQAERADAHVVADLHQVVDLRAAADHRLAQRGAIDAGAGAHFDVVLHPDDACLRHLAVHRTAAVSGKIESEAEPVAAHHRVRLQDHAVAKHAVLAHHRTGPEHALLADPGAVEHVRAGMQGRARADPGARTDVGAR